MQNFMELCRSLIALPVQTQLFDDKRHCNAEVNFVRLLDDPRVSFWTPKRQRLQSPSSIAGREPTSDANKSAVARIRLGRYKRW